MRRFGWIILNVATFGLAYVFAKHYAKKCLINKNTALSLSDNVNFNIDDLIKTLGGSDNIIKVDATISTIKINVKNATNIGQNNFNGFPIKGCMKNENQIVLVVGDNANAIANLINQNLKKNNNAN